MAIQKPNISGAFEAGAATPFSTEVVDWDAAVGGAIDAYKSAIDARIQKQKAEEAEKKAEAERQKEAARNQYLINNGYATSAVLSEDQYSLAVKKATDAIAGAKTGKERRAAKRELRQIEKTQKRNIRDRDNGIINIVDADPDDDIDVNLLTSEDKDKLIEATAKLPESKQAIIDSASMAREKLLKGPPKYNPQDPAQKATMDKLDAIIRGEIGPGKYSVVNGSYTFGINRKVDKLDAKGQRIQAKNPDGTPAVDGAGNPIWEQVDEFEEIVGGDPNSLLNGLNPTIQVDDIYSNFPDDFKTKLLGGDLTRPQFEGVVKDNVLAALKVPGQKAIFARQLFANDPRMQEYDTNGTPGIQDDELENIPDSAIVTMIEGSIEELVPKDPETNKPIFLEKSEAQREEELYRIEVRHKGADADKAEIEAEQAKTDPLSLGVTGSGSTGDEETTHIRNVKFDQQQNQVAYEGYSSTITDDAPLGSKELLTANDKLGILDVKYDPEKGYRIKTATGWSDWKNKNQYQVYVATKFGGKVKGKK